MEPDNPPVRAPVGSALAEAVVLLALWPTQFQQTVDVGQDATAAWELTGLGSRCGTSHQHAERVPNCVPAPAQPMMANSSLG